VDAFLTSRDSDLPDEEELSLGLTFSFPVEQKALDSGLLLTWTKGFSAKNAVGNDVVKMLQDAFDRKHLHVRCVALVNDVSHLRILVVMKRLINDKITRLWVLFCQELIPPVDVCSALFLARVQMVHTLKMLKRLTNSRTRMSSPQAGR